MILPTWERQTAEKIWEWIDEKVLDTPNDSYLQIKDYDTIVAGILRIIEREPPDPPGWEGGFARNH